MEEPVGRRRQQQILDDILRRAVSDGQQVAHVHGEAGIGKSTVLADLRRRAVSNGWSILDTGLTEAEIGLSWAGLAVLVRQVPPDVRAAVPAAQSGALRAALGEDTGVADPLLVAGALTQVLESMAAAAPLLVVVDDLHWLDRATAGALSYAVRATGGARIAFVFASRRVAIPIDLHRIMPADRLVDLSVDGLSVAGLKALVEQRCGVRLQRVELIRLHGTTGGNPLHAIEAGRLMSAGRSLEQSLLPPSLRTAVDEHLGLLPPHALAVLRAAALSARPRTEELAALFPADEVEAALVAAEQVGLIQVEGASVRFCHPTFTAALVDSLGALERRVLERRLAEVVTDVEEQALHRAAATVGTNDVAAAAMATAAAAAERRGAEHLAVERSARALELTPPADPELNRRRLELADRLDAAGDDAAALVLYRQVLDSDPTDDERWDAAKGVTVATCHAAGETAGASTLPDLEHAAGDVAERRAETFRMTTRIFLHLDLAEAERAGVAWSELARAQAWDDRRRVQSEISLGVIRVLQAQPVDVLALRRRALDSWPDDRTAAIGAVCELLVWTDDLDEAVLDLERAVTDAERQGRTMLLLNSLDQLADARARLGRWDEAAACLERYLELSHVAFDGMGLAPRAADLAYLDALRGRSPKVPQLPAERTLSGVERAQVRCRRGSILLLGGDAAGAAVELSRADELLSSVGLVDSGALIFRGDLVQALLECGQVDDAMAVVARLEAVAATSRRQRAAAEAARARAMVLAAQGHLDGAAASCEQALVGYRELRAPYEEARTLLLAGTVVRRSGRRSEARDLLRAARSVFEQLGAVPFVRRTDDELARVGGETTGGITPTERQVAQLVVAGKSNAEIASSLFVSVRTVESNLTKLYRKVGVRSRTELVAYLASRAMN